MADPGGVLPEKVADEIAEQQHIHPDTSSSSGDSWHLAKQEEQDRSESAALIEAMFYNLTGSGDRCTFGSASKNLRLKDTHIQNTFNFA